MAITYIYEFLYRGNPSTSADQPTWQVTLGGTVTDPLTGTEQPWVSGTLNVSQAEAAGWPLTTIISEINAELAKQNETLLAQVADLEQQLQIALEPQPELSP